MHTVGFLGKGGGQALEIADHAIVIPSESTARIQEMHITIGHILCELIEEGLGLNAWPLLLRVPLALLGLILF